MTTESALRLDAIVRVSKTGERDYLRSPDQQEADIRAWADERGYEIVTVHRAIDESAGKGAYPAIEEAKERALDGITDGAVVAYLSRYSRNTLYGLQTVATLLDAGRHFFAIDCPFNLRTKEGRKYLTNQLAEAEYEWHVRREGFMRGVRDAVANGVHIGVPFGYMRSDGKGTPLAINDAEAPAVRIAWEMRADGHSWQAIADALNASGIMPRPYKRHKVVKQAVWTHKTVRQLVVGREKDVVGNRVYLGTAWNGQHETPGAHPAIVDEDLYARATEARGTKWIGSDDGYLLSGLVRCKSCGYVMTYNGADFLRCRAAQHGDGTCPDPVGVNARKLEEVVVGEFKDRYFDAKLDAHADDDAVADATAKVARLAIRHDNIFASMPADMSGARGENWREHERQAGEALADAEREEAEAKAQARGANLPHDLTADNFDTWPVPDQRTFLAAVFAAVVVRRPARWREPVAARTHVLRRDEVPANNIALIAHVARA
jgi:DNA invertase Pin-like site-specific DNA recombinase